MKKTIFPAAAILAAIILAGQTGYGADARLERAIQKAGEIRSYRADTLMTMNMALTTMGQTIPMETTSRMALDWTKEPLRTKGDMTSTAAGQTTHAVSYAERQGDNFVSYMKQDGQDWVRMTMDASAFAQSSGAFDLGTFLQCAADFEPAGTETVGGAEATVYSGTLTAGDLDGVMDLGQMIGAIGSAMGFDLGELDLEAFGGIPMTVAIDNGTGMFVKYTMDMTGFMNKLGPVLVDRMLETLQAQTGQTGLSAAALGLSVAFPECRGEAEFRDFDGVGPIEIPGEARAAKPLPALFQPAAR